MKFIKQTIFALTLIIVLSNFVTKSFNVTNKTGDKIEAFFSHKLDFNDVAKIKLDLSQKEVIINYQLLQFDDTGKLKAIEFNVISEGVYRGKGASKILTDDSKFGFAIDRSPEAPVYFRVGSL